MCTAILAAPSPRQGDDSGFLYPVREVLLARPSTPNLAEAARDAWKVRRPEASAADFTIEANMVCVVGALSFLLTILRPSTTCSMCAMHASALSKKYALKNNTNVFTIHFPCIHDKLEQIHAFLLEEVKIEETAEERCTLLAHTPLHCKIHQRSLLESEVLLDNSRKLVEARKR